MTPEETLGKGTTGKYYADDSNRRSCRKCGHTNTVRLWAKQEVKKDRKEPGGQTH